MKVKIEHNASQVRAVLSGAPDRFMGALDRALSRGVQELVRVIRRNVPQAHSHFVNSINSKRLAQADYLAYAGVDYAGYPETGTGPGGSPSRQTLLDWIRVKGITPRDPSMTLDELAYVIGRSIRRKGTRAQPSFGPALESHRSRLAQLVSTELGNEAGRLA